MEKNYFSFHEYYECFSSENVINYSFEHYIYKLNKTKFIDATFRFVLVEILNYCEQIIMFSHNRDYRSAHSLRNIGKVTGVVSHLS